ncbi:MAG: DUF2029 domain-containing protein [Thermoflexia bacterium]|nr:MAG: DUF2029 domain-containing protein [Thermoflexia bacterium]
MASVASRRKSPVSCWRWLLLIAAGVGLLVFSSWRLTRPDILRWDDFVVFWAAGRLNAQGHNPYDAESLFALERAAGRPSEEASAPLQMWNPPWTLLLLTPFGLLPYPLARALWFSLHFAALVWSADRLWLLSSGPGRARALAWLLALLFGPALQALKVGQMSPILLTGLAGLLFFARRERLGAAGVAASLLLIKPHVAHLVLTAIFLQVLFQRQRALGFGLLLPPLAALLAVAWMNPAVLPGSIYALLNNPAQERATPTPGAWLRVLFGVEHLWLQFLPTALALLLFAGYALRHRNDAFITGERLPSLVLFSLLTMPYGWTYDHAVALAAILPAAVHLGWRPRNPLWWGLWGMYGGVNGILMFVGGDMFWHIWVAPFWLLWVAAARRAFPE